MAIFDLPSYPVGDFGSAPLPLTPSAPVYPPVLLKPVADIDDDVLRTDEFIFVISSAQINRPASGAGGFHQTKLFLIVVYREANMVDSRLLGRLAFPCTGA
jgi:hypothetical protein